MYFVQEMLEKNHLKFLVSMIGNIFYRRDFASHHLNQCLLQVFYMIISYKLKVCYVS